MAVFGVSPTLVGELNNEQAKAQAAISSLLGGGSLPGLPSGWRPDASMLQTILGIGADLASRGADMSAFEQRYVNPYMGGMNNQGLYDAVTNYIVNKQMTSAAPSVSPGVLGRLSGGGFNEDTVNTIGSALAELIGKYSSDPGLQGAYKGFMNSYGGNMASRPLSMWGSVAEPYLAMGRANEGFAKAAPGATFPSSMNGLSTLAQQALRGIGMAAMAPEAPANKWSEFIGQLRTLLGRTKGVPGSSPAGGGGSALSGKGKADIDRFVQQNSGRTAKDALNDPAVHDELVRQFGADQVRNWIAAADMKIKIGR